MPPAARLTDTIVSPATLGVPVPIIPPCAPTVIIFGMPAARVTDNCVVDVIVKGSMTVIISGMPAARLADLTASGGAVLSVCAPTVMIGG